MSRRPAAPPTDDGARLPRHWGVIVVAVALLAVGLVVVGLLVLAPAWSDLLVAAAGDDAPRVVLLAHLWGALTLVWAGALVPALPRYGRAAWGLAAVAAGWGAPLAVFVHGGRGASSPPDLFDRLLSANGVDEAMLTPSLLVLAAVPLAAVALAHARSRRSVAVVLAWYLGAWGASAAFAVSRVT
ncbi:hypothetical protein [Nocardioides nanhaiensis]|uniref:Uncharacterized protein n=1 Tax=Nocardioides nanhaiensis TaxID=1476871 RepID=A0ABP8VQE3_9ACTN